MRKDQGGPWHAEALRKHLVLLRRLMRQEVWPLPGSQQEPETCVRAVPKQELSAALCAQKQTFSREHGVESAALIHTETAAFNQRVHLQCQAWTPAHRNGGVIHTGG